VEQLEVPETLHALIAARLDGLEPRERRLLQDAAVLGKTFTRRALIELSDCSEEELDPLLRSLVQKEVLGLQADPRSPEHGQYSFLQDLIRHVAYERLSKGERRSRHLAAAAHLQAAFPDDEEIVEVLASHYLEAYRASPEAPDSGGIKAGAREMLARAGGRAASLAAAREGQRYFEQAAELADDPLTRAALDDRAGQMAWRRGRGGEARALFEQAISAYDEAGLTPSAARVSARLAEVEARDGHLAEAVARLEHALETLSREEPGEDVAVVAGQLGRYLILSGRFDEAAPHLELALGLAEAFDSGEVFAQALSSKSVFLVRQNRLREAGILLEAALASAVADDLPAAAARASNNLAVVFESRDRYAESIVTVRRGVEFARRIGDRVWEGQMLAGEVSSLVLLGRWQEAVERPAELERAGTLSAGNESLLLPLVQIDCWRGRVAEGKARLERYGAGARAAEDIQQRSMYGLQEAIVLRAEGKPSAALDVLEGALRRILDELGISFVNAKLTLVEALECAAELDDSAKLEELLAIVDRLRPGERPPLLAAQAARFRAKRAADPTKAGRGFARAAELFAELGTVFWLAVTQLEHAEWLVERQRIQEAEPLLAEARETFERLEAAPWLKRVGRTAEPKGPGALVEAS
jgi:tetratricopeptide (TPR) repeat protein